MSDLKCQIETKPRENWYFFQVCRNLSPGNGAFSRPVCGKTTPKSPRRPENSPPDPDFSQATSLAEALLACQGPEHACAVTVDRGEPEGQEDLSSLSCAVDSQIGLGGHCRGRGSLLEGNRCLCPSSVYSCGANPTPFPTRPQIIQGPAQVSEKPAKGPGCPGKAVPAGWLARLGWLFAVRNYCRAR